MKPVHALAVILPASLLLPGCPFECGAFAGDGDTMYRRGDDVLFLCSNGGFTLSFGGQAIAGRFAQDSKQFDGASGETGARVFSLEVAADGSATSPELGAGWATVALDRTALDHADVQCTGLTTQPWWPQDDALPAMTAFSKPAGGFASVADCRAAQHAGTYPARARCEDSALLCPDGQMGMTGGSGVADGSYTASFGDIAGSTPAGQIQGVFAADGTLHSGSDVWRQIPIDQADPALVSAGCGAGT